MLDVIAVFMFGFKQIGPRHFDPHPKNSDFFFCANATF